eukprot:9592672-Alexandrium_andersonii.AAC.1
MQSYNWLTLPLRSAPERQTSSRMHCLMRRHTAHQHALIPCMSKRAQRLEATDERDALNRDGRIKTQPDRVA